MGGLYYLYQDKYFDKFFTKVEYIEKENIKTSDVENVSKEKESEIDLNQEYSSYLENIIISENSDYKKDFYSGNLTNELKLSLTINLVDEDYILIEDNSVILDDGVLEDKYKDIFSDVFIPMSFKYNGLSFKYLKSQHIFIADGIGLNKENNIKREIVNVEQKDNKLYITTLEALIKDGKVYNVLTNKKIGNFKNSLKDYEKQINSVIYEFEDSSLIDIRKG